MDNFNVILPVFRDVTYNILDFGAVEGGKISNTTAINNAINKANLDGGGIVIIPKGFWLSGPINLKSNVNLHLERSSYIICSKSKEENKIIIADYEGQPRLRATSPINAYDCSNIAITGYGTIDGSGHLWRPVKAYKMTGPEWKRLLSSNDECIIKTKECDIWCPSSSYLDGCLIGEPSLDDPLAIEKATDNYDFYRPVLLNLVRCSNILLEGVIFSNSPAWNIHPIFCNNLTVKNITVKNPSYAQNGDGIDVESCKNVHIYDSIFEVGDDGICLKSGKNEIARKKQIPTENVYIHDCTVYHAHGGIVFGSEMSRGIKNVTVRDCTFIGTDIGIRFKSAIGRGGIVEDILIENIRMIDIINEAIIMTMGYVLYTIEHEKEDKVITNKLEDIPVFRNIIIRNIICLGSKIGILLNGLNEIPIHNITFENVAIRAKSGYKMERIKNINFNNVTFLSEKDINKVIKFDNKIINESEELNF